MPILGPAQIYNFKNWKVYETNKNIVYSKVPNKDMHFGKITKKRI